MEPMYRDTNHVSTVIQNLENTGIALHDKNATVYKYTSIEAAKNILETNSLRYSSPVAFDDAFELSIDYFDFSFKMQVAKKIIMETWARQNPHIDFKRIKKDVENLSKNEILQLLLDAFHQTRKVLLMSCFSKYNSSNIMWGLYANKGKGVCIGLKIPSILPSLDILAMNVNYPTIVMPQKIFAIDQYDRDYAVFYWLFTKQKEWAYQAEVRSVILATENLAMVKRSNDYCDIAMNQGEKLCEIYYGHNSTDKDRNDLEAIIKNHNYPIDKKAIMRANKFMLEPLYF